MFLAVLATFTVAVQAQTAGTITVGDYDAPTELYNGSYFDMAPTNFYLAHTGAQLIYTADELADLQDKHEVKITSLAFKFYSESFEDIIRDVKIYLEATDATEFAVVKEVKQFFPFENPVMEVEQTYEMLNYYGEDMDVPLASVTRVWSTPTTGPVSLTLPRVKISPMLPLCWVAVPT